MYVWASGGHRPPRVLTNSRRTASQTGSESISTPSRSKPESAESGLHLGRGTSERGVVSCARSVTHRRVRALACSSPPTAHLAPHPNLRRPIGRSGLTPPRRPASPAVSPGQANRLGQKLAEGRGRPTSLGECRHEGCRACLGLAEAR